MLPLKILAQFILISTYILVYTHCTTYMSLCRERWDGLHTPRFWKFTAWSWTKSSKHNFQAVKNPAVKPGANHLRYLHTIVILRTDKTRRTVSGLVIVVLEIIEIKQRGHKDFYSSTREIRTLKLHKNISYIDLSKPLK